MELLEYQKRYHRMVLHPQENGLTPIEEDQQTSHLQRILISLFHTLRKC